jgi:hypothetical protein
VSVDWQRLPVSVLMVLFLRLFLGREIYDNIKRFYSVVRVLFTGGNVGGVEIYAQKPLGW